MKIQILITSLVLTSATYSKTVTATALNPTKRSEKEDLYLRKRSNAYSNLEEAYNELKSIVLDLKEYVHDDYIEILHFDTDQAELQTRIENLKTFINSRRFPNSWQGEFEYASFLFESMVEVAEAFKIGCEYWGSYFVEGMGRICVRVLSLYRMEGDPLDMETHRKIARLEDKFNVLQNQISPEELMPMTTRNRIKAYEKNVQKALDLVKQNVHFDKAWAGEYQCKEVYTRLTKDKS